jgi:hypothetical protein
MGVFQSCLGKPEYTGKEDALYNEWTWQGENGARKLDTDMMSEETERAQGAAKIRLDAVKKLIKAGVNVRYQVSE